MDVYEGIARNKSQISATAGGMIGEANRQANRSKVYYGLPKEPGKADSYFSKIKIPVDLYLFLLLFVNEIL